MFRNAKFSMTRMCNWIINIILSHVVQNAKRNAVQQDCQFPLNKFWHDTGNKPEIQTLYIYVETRNYVSQRGATFLFI